MKVVFVSLPRGEGSKQSYLVVVTEKFVSFASALRRNKLDPFGALEV